MSIEVRDAEVLGAFARMESLGTNMQPWLEIIADHWENNTRLHFHDGRGPTGTPWAPITETTATMLRPWSLPISQRRARGFGPPLRDKGLMANSISHSSGANYAEVGTNSVQARMQHFGAAKGAFGSTRRGSTIPLGNVPGRPFLGFGPVDQAMALEVFAEAFQNAQLARAA